MRRLGVQAPEQSRVDVIDLLGERQRRVGASGSQEGRGQLVQGQRRLLFVERSPDLYSSLCGSDGALHVPLFALNPGDVSEDAKPQRHQVGLGGEVGVDLFEEGERLAVAPLRSERAPEAVARLCLLLHRPAAGSPGGLAVEVLALAELPPLVVEMAEHDQHAAPRFGRAHGAHAVEGGTEDLADGHVLAGVVGIGFQEDIGEQGDRLGGAPRLGLGLGVRGPLSVE